MNLLEATSYTKEMTKINYNYISRMEFSKDKDQVQWTICVYFKSCHTHKFADKEIYHSSLTTLQNTSDYQKKTKMILIG
jgi:hypothetical protein